MAIRVPAKISDEMFSLVWDVLREFGEEIERVETLKVLACAARGGAEYRTAVNPSGCLSYKPDAS